MFTMGRSGHRTGRDVPTERKGDASCTTGAWGDKFRRSEALLNRWPRPSLRQKKHCRGGDSSRRATAKSVAIERPSGDGGTTSHLGTSRSLAPTSSSAASSCTCPRRACSSPVTPPPSGTSSSRHNACRPPVPEPVTPPLKIVIRIHAVDRG